MLRILSAKIFREDIEDYGLPTVAFENFDDIKKYMDLNNDTYKFLLPVSIGDFAESNVPACFSNKEKELYDFYEVQKKHNKRKAFIISDFSVDNLDDICYSGTIHLSSNTISSGIEDKNTVITITYQNPIKTYAEKNISPRDLPEDVVVKYNRLSDNDHSFPEISDKSNHPKQETQSILLQAFDASLKLHDISFAYDGTDYSNYVLFYVNNKGKINIYEIVGEKSFINKEEKPIQLIKKELSRLK